MAEKIVMPQLGESIAEGTVVKWLKNPGDSVQKDENLLLISTDKVEAEIPSPAAGVLLRIEAQPGQTLPVGSILGYVGEKGDLPESKEGQSKEQKPPKPQEETEEKPEAKQKQEQKPPEESLRKDDVEVVQKKMQSEMNSRLGERFLSPLVRRIAAENQISKHELEELPGSGRDNRITKEDILQYVAFRDKGPKELQTQKVEKPAFGWKPIEVAIPSGEQELVIPVSTMRRVIMENMVRSKQTSAHVTTFFEVDYTKIDHVRQLAKERFLKEEGVPLTYTTFLAYAVCQTLKRHPYIHAEVAEGKIKFKKDIHLAIAVAITEPEPGLMVPVIRHADQMNLRGLARNIVDLANRVRNKKIKPDELSGGSFTITNPGNFGAIIGTPIINQPQVAILGVGNIQKRAVVVEVDGTDMIGIRKMGWLSLSFDHRLIDGATADMFMADLKHTLENWTAIP